MQENYSRRPLSRLSEVAGRLLFAGLFPIALLAGCKTSNSDNPTAQKFTIGFSAQSSDPAGDPWHLLLANSIINAAASRGDTLYHSGANHDQTTQLAQIRSFIAQKVQLIAFDPVTDLGWDSVLGEAKAAGIPVILVDSAILTENPDLYSTTISSDYLWQGQQAGIWVRDKSGVSSSSLSIAELQGPAGWVQASDRAIGFRDIIDPSKIALSSVGDWSTNTAQATVAGWIGAGQLDGINVIYAHNDSMALGAVAALQAAVSAGKSGMRPGIDIKIVSIDGMREAVQAILSGTINCTIETNPMMGTLLLDAAASIIAGDSVGKWVTRSNQVLTSDVVVNQAYVDARPY
jgi:simple sugar transport system substrate-binding protein